MTVNVDPDGVPMRAAALRQRGAAWAAGFERKLAAAGVPATLDNSVIRVGEMAFDCTPGVQDTREEVYNALVVATCRERLLDLARTHLASVGPDLHREPPIEIRPTDFGAVAATPDGDVADITASYIHLAVTPLMTGPPNGVSLGNFLRDGTHWHYAAKLIRSARRRQSMLKRSRTFVTAGLPGGLTRDEAAAAMDATRRLRLERTIAYGHVVELRRGDGTMVRLDPVFRHDDSLELDFTCSDGDKSFSGALLLNAAAEHLPVRILSGDAEFASTAAITALAGAAELLCVAYTTESAPRVSAPSTRYAQGSRRDRDRDRDRDRHLESRRFGRRPAWLSNAVTPTGATLDLVSSYVVGHLRRLLAGQSSSAQALANAYSVGIDVPERFTWVKPHARGAPPDAVLTFHWTT